MSQSNIQHITLPPGEKCELVFINDANIAWHVVQEAGSALRVHVLYLSKDEKDVQWHSSLTVEHLLQPGPCPLHHGYACVGNR